MKQIAPFLLLCMTCILINCDPEKSEYVNQDRINTDYAIIYKNNNNTTEATASFWFGSTPLKLESPADVTVNDRSMKEEDFLGIVQYYKNLDGYLSPVTFQYIDHDRNVYVNNISPPDEIQLPSKLPPFSITEDLTINWVGTPIGIRESVELEISNTNGEVYHAYKSNTGSTSIRVDAYSLGMQFVGDVKMKFSRTKKHDLQQAPRKGDISATYASKKIIVAVTN